MYLYVATKEWDCQDCQGVLFIYHSAGDWRGINARCIYCNCAVIIDLSFDNVCKLDVDENVFSFIKKLGA